ncbi:hypothetical protein EX30DRAFT_211133 [Ascodesmis nigricans]|uniref:Uncharacterized protein n=1 Tax=Ascodesmis nigricans TaxID=341454 RepID=A0A4S2MJQ0_9PEZI|nr:hypothetical protein EX30DRAFT_211133 [Ascodesmis nigricans]
MRDAVRLPDSPLQQLTCHESMTNAIRRSFARGERLETGRRSYPKSKKMRREATDESPRKEVTSAERRCIIERKKE